MKLKDVIAKVDKWQPNVFDTQDKLDWCYELARDLWNTSPKILSYTGTVARDGGTVALPLGVKFSDCVEIYVNGKRKVKLDERTYEDLKLKKGDEVYVAYRYVPEPYQVDSEGEVPEELETVCDVPFASMYMDYVCAQIALQQNDAEEYNKYISVFNVKFSGFQNFVGANSPITAKKSFVNYF